MKHDIKSMNEDNGEYVERRSSLSLVIAAIACLLLAVLVWFFVMNANDTKTLPLVLVGGEDEYSYVFSDTELEVSGAVLFLKKAKQIEVVVPEEATAPGTHVLTIENLVLPEGVSLSELTGMTLTVSEK